MIWTTGALNFIFYTADRLPKVTGLNWTNRQNNGLFSEKSAQRREDKKSSKTEEGGEEDQNSSNGSETESLAEDLKLAWENLEIARLIFEKYINSIKRDLKIEDYASYADVLVYLGIVMFESGKNWNL